MRQLLLAATARCRLEPPERLVTLVVPLPAAAGCDRLLSARIPGERLLLDTPGAPFSFAGSGVAAQVVASGAARLATIARDGTTLLAGLCELRGDGAKFAPPASLFGGAAFQPGEAPDPGWLNFGEAAFTLPRWLLATGPSGCFLRLTVTAAELSDRLRLLREHAAVAVALALPAPRTAPGPKSLAFLAEQRPSAYRSHVTEALAAIGDGTLSKVVLARRSLLLLDAPPDLAGTLARLAEALPASTRFAVERGGGCFLGATPERLVTLRGAKLWTEALAGTWRAGDVEAARSLLAAPKERHEHALVVAGIAAALAPFAELSTAGAPQLRHLPGLSHLVTPLTGTLRAPTHVLSLVAALHPTPAVGGLPREDALRFIAAAEPCPRGWYAGPLGHFDAAGDGEFVVAIRSAVIRGSTAWLYAGAGIVAGSEPEQELRETAAKQETLLGALRAAP